MLKQKIKTIDEGETHRIINISIVNPTGVIMSKQYYNRDEVKALLREVIERKRKDAEITEEESSEPEKTYTLDEVKALIIKDREARKTS